jgi:lipopolysaccharide transport system ATP-binding protein
MLKVSGTYATDEDIVLHITIEAFKDVPNCRINYTIFSAAGDPIANHSSNHLFSIRKGEVKSLEYTIVNPHLAIGDYTVSFSVGTGNMLEGETNYDVVPHILSFSIDRFKKDEEAFFAKWNSGWGNICAEANVKELS